MLFDRQFHAGVDDDRQIVDAQLVAHRFQELEARHAGQTQIEHDTVDTTGAKFRQALLGARGQGGLEVVALAEHAQHLLLHRQIVLDDQQLRMRARLGRSDALEQLTQRAFAHGLLQIARRAVAKPAWPFVFA